MQGLLYTIVLSALLLPDISLGERIAGLNHYEVLQPHEVTHQRSRRSLPVGTNEAKEVKFHSMGRDFHLHLQKHHRLLSSGFKITRVDKHGNVKPADVQKPSFYEGYVIGEAEQSYVQAYEEDNILAATITTKEGIYSIEPAWRHLANHTYADRTVIVYKDSDIQMNKDIGKNFCGYVIEGLNQEWEQEEEKRKQEEMLEPESTRQKRQTSSFSPSKTTCSLLLVADYRFYRNMGRSNLASTSSYLIGLLDRINAIYRQTDFGQGYDDMGFEIGEMRIHEEETAVSGSDEHYNMRKDTAWDTKDLLEVFSRTSEFKNFCLAHLFTYQAFAGGVLGLAYIGSPRVYSVGGICSPSYNKGGYTMFLNTGWSSSQNTYGRRLLTQEADLVTAHEFGHNWGSEHDVDTGECSPSSREGGKYIMYTYSVSGYDRNNKIFSPCSTKAMGMVLRSKSANCFREPSKQFCGNSLLEEGEECDPGAEVGKDQDPCCTKECKLRPNAKCSDINHVCCQNCDFAPKSVICRGEQGTNLNCEKEANCDGKSLDCPPGAAKPDGTECGQMGQCKGGTCQAFCESLGKTSCVCDDTLNSCKWCCIDNKGNGTCLPHQFENGPLPLPEGVPCVIGYCSKEGECQKNVRDLVQRFWDIIENITPSLFVELMRKNIVHVVIFFSLLIWIPVSCWVSWKDRKAREKHDKENEYFNNRSEQLHYDETQPRYKVHKATRRGAESPVAVRPSAAHQPTRI